MEKLFVKKLDDGKEFKIMVRLINNSVAVPFGTLCEYLGISRTYWAKKLINDLIRSDEGFIYLTTFQFRAKKIYPRTLEGEYWKKVILGLHEGELLFYKSEEQKQYKDQLDDLRIKCYDLEQERNLKQTEIQVLQGIISDKNKEFDKLKIQSNEIMHQYKNLGRKYNELVIQKEDMLKNLGITEIKAFQDIITDKNKELTETKDQLELVRNHNTDLQISLSNANDMAEFLQAKNKELKKQQRKLNQALGVDLLNMAQQLLNMKEV
jgi:hypothetical protein